jgi:hypothetical protein
MRFKQYLNEMENLTGIESSQAEEAHEPTGEGSSAIDNPRIFMELNLRLVNEMNQVFLSPESGIQIIRKVLHRFGFDLPALYDADPEGDEVVIEINQFGQEDLSSNIYILYYLTDAGYYEFYAEIGDEETMEDLLSDEGDSEEEN